ncbi:MAG: Flp pilus assembly protein CpaB [Maricaulaceae bacterium]
MDTKRVALVGGLIVLAIVVFTQAKKMGTPAKTVAAPVKTIVEKVAYKQVLVATGDIPFGSRLTALNMQWKQWPAEAMSQEFISQNDRPNAIENLSGGVVRSAVFAGEPITDRRYVKPGTQGVMAALIQDGMRAVTTEISTESAAGGFIQPGDNVDIILTSQMPRNPTNRSSISSKMYKSVTIFENIKVLAIDQTYNVGPDGGASVIGQTATFEMTQADSETLQAAAASGDLALTLRPLMSSHDRKRPSQSKSKLNFSEDSSQTLAVYRSGHPTQVAIKGQ